MGRLRAGIDRFLTADVLIVPVGLIFDDKIAMRSRVLGRISDPIDVDRVVATMTSANTGEPTSQRVQVQALTRLITTRLLRWRVTIRMKTTTTRWRLAGAGVSGLAAISLYVLGRTGGPWCNPDSWLQPHAGWHILMATSVTLFALSWVGGRRNSLDPK